MNKKGLYYGIAYSIFVIAFKLFILLGGYSLSHFGWYYSNVTGVFLIIPFYYLAIKSVRDKDQNGFIGGREAMRIALTVFATGAVLVSVYNYFEFQYSGKAMAIEYYNSQQFLDFLKSQSKIKPENYSKIIEEQVKNSELSAFKATTGKLFSFMLIGISGAVIVSMSMRRKQGASS